MVTTHFQELSFLVGKEDSKRKERMQMIIQGARGYPQAEQMKM